MSDASNASPRLIRVWDPGVRIFHWLLVIAVALTFLSSEEEGAFSAWHIPIGWACALLIVFRLVWGIVGGEHARFINFMRPSEIVPHVRHLLSGDLTPTIGHNPLGALAVLALLGLTVATIFTGVSGGEHAHETVAYMLLWLVVMHVAAVALMSYVTKDNLILAMVTGKKRRDLFPDAKDASPPSRSAVPVAAIAVAAVAYGATRIDPQAFVPHSGAEAGEGGEHENVQSGEASESDDD
ncbi:MAG: cytochrome b/b6 domain-containing protein [Hyphomonadaceae bacterium]